MDTVMSTWVLALNLTAGEWALWVGVIALVLIAILTAYRAGLFGRRT